jgi:hypothetical protein
MHSRIFNPSTKSLTFPQNIMRYSIFIASLVALIVALSGCSKTDKDAAPSGSTISITSMSPAIGQQLRVGSTVKMKVNVAYWLSVDTGSVGLVVQTADTKSIAQDERMIKKGGGELVFESEFIVPDTPNIRIFVPLNGDNQTATSTLDTRSYAVTKP